jgi:hypothetical protein
MDEQAAKKLAKALGGEAWQSGGGIWLVILYRPDGGLVVFSEDLVAEYPDEDAFDASTPTASIYLRGDPTEYWIVEDADGGIWMDDPNHGRGWSTEEYAQEEATAIQSRIGTRCFVRQQRLADTLQHQ